MEGAEAPDEIGRVDAGDGAVGETGGDSGEGDAVVGVVEGGHEDERVGDVEVGVGGGEALPVEDDGRGHGEGAEGEGLAVAVAGGAKAVEVFGEGEVVFVVDVGFDGGEDGVAGVAGAGDEAGDVVDVAVGVVAGTAAVEPEDVVDAEVAIEGGFQLLTGDAGVAGLDRGEETFFGGEEGAFAVGVDGAAFEDEAVRGAVGEGDGWLDAGHGVVGGDMLGNPVVVNVVGVLGPAVEAPVGEGDLARGGFDEDGAGVAEPDAVGTPGVEVKAGEVGALAAEHASGTLLGGEVVDQDVNVFDVREEADDLGVDPGDGLELAGPVGGVVGPGDPGGGVRGPLGGHAAAA